MKQVQVKTVFYWHSRFLEIYQLDRECTYDWFKEKEKEMKMDLGLHVLFP